MSELDSVELIKRERERQVSTEGWTPEHDDQHQYGALAKRAAELAVNGTDAEVIDHLDGADCWGLVSKHKGDRIRQLVIAGALITSEIERVMRRDNATATTCGAVQGAMPGACVDQHEHQSGVQIPSRPPTPDATGKERLTQPHDYHKEMELNRKIGLCVGALKGVQLQCDEGLRHEDAPESL